MSEATVGTNTEVVNEAVRIIDAALSQMMSRELVSAGEVTDVLLDLRTLLVGSLATQRELAHAES
jgi:hypothetical protein